MRDYGSLLSYDSKDRPIAREIEKGLVEKGHESVWGVDELIAGRGWGELMPKRIAEADAVVAVLTANSLQSATVWCEIGAARALTTGPRRLALLPVTLGDVEAPAFLQDTLVLADHWTNDMASLIGEVDRAISAHFATLRTEAARLASPMIFISHRHKDAQIARALADVLSTSFDLSSRDIRCTSVQPYRLPFGKNTGDRLRGEIKNARAVLGILSPDTSQSSYVMFELGAAWAERVYTCPLLSRGAAQADVPGPIFDLTPAHLWVDTDCYQLIENLEAELNIPRKRENTGQLQEKIRALTAAAAPPAA